MSLGVYWKENEGDFKMTTNTKVQMRAYSDHSTPPEGEDRFTERRRIAMSLALLTFGP